MRGPRRASLPLPPIKQANTTGLISSFSTYAALRCGFGGSFAPDLRASESPIAIACFGFVTFLPLRPLLSFPCFISFISSSTWALAEGLYLRCEVLVFLEAVLVEALLAEAFFVDDLLAEADFVLERFAALRAAV